MKSELRFTDTNAASDSKGRTWGLEGGLFWWLVGGVGVAITVFFVLLVMMNTSLLTAFLVALVPVGICLAYIFGFRQGKPPGYDRDCFEHWFSGGGFAPEVQAVRIFRHPLSEEQPSIPERPAPLTRAATCCSRGFRPPIVPCAPACINTARTP